MRQYPFLSRQPVVSYNKCHILIELISNNIYKFIFYIVYCIYFTKMYTYERETCLIVYLIKSLLYELFCISFFSSSRYIFTFFSLSLSRHAAFAIISCRRCSFSSSVRLSFAFSLYFVSFLSSFVRLISDVDLDLSLFDIYKIKHILNLS